VPIFTLMNASKGRDARHPTSLEPVIIVTQEAW
jgi:hypothetical protein